MIQISFAERDSVKIDQGWGLVPDPMERSRRQSWWKSSRKPGFFFPSYDEDSFWPTRVPSAYNIEHPRLEFFEGLTTYRVHFSAKPAAEGEKVFLVFEAVADRCQVFLNGKLVGHHDGPYTPFNCDVTKLIEAENRLMVYVDCSRQEDSVPGKIHDWFHYGGIHRAVRLYRVPKVFVQDAALETELLSGGKVRLGLRVRISDKVRGTRHEVKAALVDEEGKRVVEWSLSARGSIWEKVVTEVSLDSVKLWSPGSPNLYRLVVECGTDKWEEETGLRQIETRGNEIILNGEPIFLRGVCSWIIDPVQGMFSMSEETSGKVIELARKLNANFIRAAHWPQTREFVRACNRAGILLWMEIPAYWMPNMADPTPMNRAITCGEEMLCAHRNAPSIILWSVGNECVFHDVEKPQTNLAYFIKAADFFHEHDSTRLVTFTGGMEGAWTPHMDKICPSEFVDHLDVIGINTYSGIDDGADPAKPAEVQQLHDCILTAGLAGKPVLLAENGIDAVIGEKGFDFGEARQADYYRKVLAILDNLRVKGKIQGVSFFTLSDFRTPIKLSRHQNGYNRKGLVSEKLEPKEVFGVVSKAFEVIKNNA